MTLTKDQIIFIDDYLKRKRLKYWDIRLEMVDHLASKLENNKDLVLNEALLKNEFGDLFQIKKREQLISIAIGKKYRKIMFKEAKLLLSHFKGLSIFISIYMLEYLIFNYFENNLIIQISLALIVLSLLPSIIYSIKILIKTNKTKYLEKITNATTITFLFLNFSIILIRVLSNHDVSVFASNSFLLALFLMVFVPIHLLLVYCSIIIYRKAYKEYTNLFNEQQKLNATH